MNWNELAADVLALVAMGAVVAGVATLSTAAALITAGLCIGAVALAIRQTKGR